MSNLKDIQLKIEKLQKQANDIKAREFDKTVQEIVAKMQAFGITPRDLLTAGVRGRGRPAAASPRIRGKGRSGGAAPVASHGRSVAPKYRGPNGETWSGRGLTPRWLTGLVAQGKTKEEFAI